MDTFKFQFTAEAWDNTGGTGVREVEFHVFYDNAWHHIGTDTSAPYGLSWNADPGLAPQDLIFTIHVIDHAGNEIMDPGGYHYVHFKRNEASSIAVQIDDYLRSKGSPLAGQGFAFEARGREFDVDPRLMVAIAGAESTFGKNGSCATQRKNAWGYGGGWPSCWNFDTWDAAIRQTTWQIRQYRDVRNLHNINAIGKTWCGSGCTYWESNVRTFYREQGGDPDSNNLNFKAVTNRFQLAASGTPMLRGNPVRTGRIMFMGPRAPELQWSISEEDYATAPVIGPQDVIYVGLKNAFMAVSPVGDVLWRYEAEKKFTSAAAITNQSVAYVGNDDGRLYAFNADGTLQWTYQTGAWIRSSPVIGLDGTIYFGSSDSKLRALTPQGQLLWEFGARSWIQSPPAIGLDGTIYFGSSDYYLYAVNPTGDLKWASPTGKYIDGAPAVGPDGTVYIGSLDGALYAFDPVDGHEKWKYQTVGEIGWASPAVAADGTIYISTADNTPNDGASSAKLSAVRPDGSLKWSHDFRLNAECSPTIGADGTIYIGSNDGQLYAFSPEGNLLWALPLESYDRWLQGSVALNSKGQLFITSLWPAKLYAVGDDNYGVFLPLITQ